MIVLEASQERVWSAVHDSRQFGQWLGAEIDGPFGPGVRLSARIVPTAVDPEVAKLQEPHRGTEFEIVVERVEPMRLLVFRWHPYLPEPSSAEKVPMTLVRFELEPVAGGTRLTVIEIRFDALPEARRTAPTSRTPRGGTARAA